MSAAAELISGVRNLQRFIFDIPPSGDLYIDLAGKRGPRLYETLDYMTILVLPTNVVRVINVKMLGDSVFEVSASNGKTLKNIFEDHNITKFLQDARNDAHVLWAHHQVDICNVIDVRLLNGQMGQVQECINGDGPYDTTGFTVGTFFPYFRNDIRPCLAYPLEWKKTSPAILARMARGQSLAIGALDIRANYVRYLSRQHQRYLTNLSDFLLNKVKEESKRRVKQSQHPEYDPFFPDMWHAPIDG